MTTTRLFPLGAGLQTEIPNLVGGEPTHWEAVKAASASDYVEMPAPGGGVWTYYTDLYDMDLATPAGIITEVHIDYTARSGNQTNFTITPLIRVGSTTYEGTTHVVAIGADRDYTYAWSTNPAGGDWNWTQVNAIQAGIKLGGIGALAQINCSRLYVDVLSEGYLYPTDSNTRVTSLIHRYDRGVYNLELLLGDVLADFGIPSVKTSTDKSYEPKEEQPAILTPSESVRTIETVVAEVNPENQSSEAQSLRAEIMSLTKFANATGITDYARSILLKRILELKDTLGGM